MITPDSGAWKECLAGPGPTWLTCTVAPSGKTLELPSRPLIPRLGLFLGHSRHPTPMITVILVLLPLIGLLADGRTWAFGAETGRSAANVLACNSSVVGTCKLYLAAEASSCATGTVAYNQLTGRNTAQEDVLVSVPGNFIPSYAILEESTEFSGLKSLWVSMEVQGATSNPNYIPATAFEQSAGYYYFSRPAPPVLTAHRVSIFFAGSGPFSGLTQGVMKWTLCGTRAQ